MSMFGHWSRIGENKGQGDGVPYFKIACVFATVFMMNAVIWVGGGALIYFAIKSLITFAKQ